MERRIVECIPNFSESRRPEVVHAIEDVIRSVKGIYSLDRHMDDDHNRTVITFAGEPEPVGEAAYLAIAKAAELIDMDKHSGEHPRIGATDVVPFVPISGVTMDECVELARTVGKRVGEELEIPIYLYEKAATRPDRVNLATLRKGEYEGLKEAILEDPERAPDYGPAKLGKAGATVIGARSPLIAFNIYLTTDDVTIAEKIARRVRHSSGGLRFVKALGMLVEGQAQVSMNLTDYTRTTLESVVETIRREAEHFGVSIKSSELVGLIPEAALIQAARWYLQLDAFTPEQVLERRLLDAIQAEPASEPFLDDLAAGTATPGGGAAAAYAGAMAAGLVTMVARLTIGKKKYADVEAQMEQIITDADELREKLQVAIQEDIVAFEAVMAAYRFPKSTQAEKKARNKAVEEATLRAAEVPLGVCHLAVESLNLAAQVAQDGNLNAASDAGTAGALAIAALRGAGANVRINLLDLPAHDQTKIWLAELDQLEEQSVSLDNDLKSTLLERASIPTHL
jgi:glutamate formiminotransferase/formiminotetrahydrofolate cyclodeaminase